MIPLLPIMRIAAPTARAAAITPVHLATSASPEVRAASCIAVGGSRATMLIAVPCARPLHLRAPLVPARTVSSGPTPIAASIGPNGANRVTDVRAVQRRLQDLGFDIDIDGSFGPQTYRYIRMFAAIVDGRGTWQSRTDILRPDSPYTHRLFADNAPRWVAFDTQGSGWVRTDREGYHWGTDATRDVLNATGAAYLDYSKRTGASPIGINDISLNNGEILYRRGGPDHITHRTGLDVDVRLPRLPVLPPLGGGDRRWGTDIHSPFYDRDATYKVIVGFAAQDQVRSILFADAALFERARVENPEAFAKLVFVADHDDHLHVDVIIDPEQKFIVPLRILE